MSLILSYPSRKLKGAELMLLLQAMRTFIRAPEGAIDPKTGQGIGGRFVEDDADYIILNKKERIQDITEPLMELASNQNLSVQEIELVGQNVEQKIKNNLAIELPPIQVEVPNLSIGKYLQNKFSTLQTATNDFLESESVNEFKDNLVKFVKASAPVATALAFAIAPEILIPLVMGGSVAWGSVLTSGLIGVGVDYIINKGLDKLGVENQWVRMGAAVVGGLMVGGGLIALKDKLAKKIKTLNLSLKKEEFLKVENIADDTLKETEKFSTDLKKIIKQEWNREKDLAENIQKGLSKDYSNMRALEHLFGDVNELKAIQKIIKKEQGTFREKIKEKYVDLSPLLSTRGLELIDIQKKIWKKTSQEVDKDLLRGLEWRKGLFAMEKEFGDDIDDIIKMAEDGKSIQKPYQDFLERLAERKQNKISAMSLKELFKKRFTPLKFDMPEDLGLPFYTFDDTNKIIKKFLKENKHSKQIKTVAEETIPFLDKITDFGLGKDGFSLFPNYGKALSKKIKDPSILYSSHPHSFSVPDLKTVAIVNFADKQDTKETLIHELGHLFEYHKTLPKYSRNYLDTRISDPHNMLNEKFNIPHSNFKFPYTARDYRTSLPSELVKEMEENGIGIDTEVLSIGFEKLLSNAEGFLDLARGDREHLLFTLHCLTKGYE